MKRMKAAGTKCSFAECDREAYSKGLCWTHYRQLRAWGKLRPIGYRTETARLKKEYASEFNWWRIRRSQLPERLHDFNVFIEEVGKKPDGWSTVKKVDGRFVWQPTGKRNLITHEGRSMTESQWARELGITRQALNLRLKKHGPSKALDAAELQKSKSARAPARPVTIRRLGFSGKSTSLISQHDPGKAPSGGRQQALNDKLVAAVRSGRDPEEVAQAFGVTKAQVLQAVAQQQASKSSRSPDRPTVVVRRLGFSGQSNTSVSRTKAK